MLLQMGEGLAEEVSSESAIRIGRADAPAACSACPSLDPSCRHRALSPSVLMIQNPWEV